MKGKNAEEEEIFGEHNCDFSCHVDFELEEKSRRKCAWFRFSSYKFLIVKSIKPNYLDFLQIYGSNEHSDN